MSFNSDMEQIILVDLVLQKVLRENVITLPKIHRILKFFAIVSGVTAILCGTTMFLTVFDSDDFVYVSGIMELLAGIVMVFLEAPIIVQDINRNFAEVFKKSARAPFYTRGLLYLAFSLSPPMFYSGWLCVVPEIMITCVGVAYLVIGAVQIGDEQLQKNLNVASITEHV